MHPLKTLVLLSFVLLTLGQAMAQDLPPGMKAWGTMGLQLRLNKRNAIEVSQLSAFNTGPFRTQFLQTNLGWAHKMGDRWNLDIGMARSLFKSEDEFVSYNRVLTEVEFKQKWGLWSMKHSVRAEYHFPQLRKWQSRFIYSNKISYKFKQLPFRPQPFVRNQIYWYQGGRTVKYYEEGESGEQEFLFRQAPNGFHRYRLTLGVRSRLAKRFYATVFYTQQREFNLPFESTQMRNLNVLTAKGNVQAPFNNFSLVGFRLDYTLKLY